MKSILNRFGLLALMIFALAGCGGTDGTAGAPGAPGAPGESLVNVTNLTAAEWTALKPTIDPASISVTIASPPVVNFRVTDVNGNPLVGLGTKASNGRLNNLFFTLAKLVPVTGGPSKWVSYLVTSSSDGGVTWTGNFPQQEREGTIVDNGNGTYQYTFFRDIKQAATIVAGLTDTTTKLKADLGDVSYNPALTHRLAIVIKGTQPGGTTAIELPANVTKDFRPDGGAVTTTRDIVQRSSCDGCHSGKIIGHSDRRDPKLCVTCHTDQTKYGFVNVIETTGLDPALTTPYYRTTTGEAAFTYPRMIHQTHMGEELVKTGYNLNGHCNDPAYPGYDSAKAINTNAQCLNTVAIPQSPANCTKCHDGSDTKAFDGSVNVNKTIDGDNWKLVPNRMACGACHDGIDFVTGDGITLADKAADIAALQPVGTTRSGHGPGVGPLADDSTCGSSNCHTSDNIVLMHRSTVSTLNNPGVKAGVSTITYDIKSVILNASNQPVVTFQINKDGATVTTLHTSATNPTASFPAITGLTRGPSIYVAFAVLQDNIANPADFNGRVGSSLNNLLTSGTNNWGSFTDASGASTITGDLTLSGGDITTNVANGYFTVTMGTVAKPIAIPAGAKMVTGMIVGRFEQVVNGVTVKIKPVLKTVVATIAGNKGRRVIVSAAKCNSCHDQLGTQPEFHNGERNDPTACAMCHTPNQINDGAQTKNYGWPGATNTFIHGIHAASKRSDPFTWAAWEAIFTVDENFSKIKYPGVLKNCEQCHLPGTVNFANTGGSTITPLYTTASAGTSTCVPATGVTVACPSPNTTDKTWAISPWINSATDYGLPASVSTTGVVTEAAPTTLVNSPIASACFSCHDTSLAKAHITDNGGSVYAIRSLALLKTETCLICHGVGRIADAAVVHQK